MPDEMEQIEARLAAYIDGALPPDQQAEIETYLKANPTHARLIVELKSVKSAVAALPREKAPAEVLDTLQSHLERQTLLEGVEEASMSSSRINRWPQMGAVAAMLLLTAGLGFLVYQVLPRGRAGSSELAMLTATRPVEPDGLGEDGLGAGGGSNAITGLSADRSPTEPATTRPADTAARRDQASDAVAQSSAPMMQSAARPGSAGTKAEGVTANTPAEKSAAESNPPISPALADAVRVLVVTTDDPALTRNVLVASLAAEGTPFEVTLPPGTPTAAVPADGLTPKTRAMAVGGGGAGQTSQATQSAAAESSPGQSVAVPASPDWTVATLASRLQTAGGLPADALADAPVFGGAVRPVVVRNVTPDRVAALRIALDHQRPGRQVVREQAGVVRRALPTTKPTTAPSVAVVMAPAAPPTSRGRVDIDSRVADADRRFSSTQPASAPAATATPSDLVVFIVATPTTQPVVASFVIPPAATRPSIAPGTDDAP